MINALLLCLQPLRMTLEKTGVEQVDRIFAFFNHTYIQSTMYMRWWRSPMQNAIAVRRRRQSNRSPSPDARCFRR